MPIVPFASAVGALFGTSAAVGGTIIAGTALATGLAVSQAVSNAAQAKALKNAASPTNPTPDVSQTVGSLTPNQTANAQNNGRAALISTSPSGVQGIDATGRRKLLGND